MADQPDAEQRQFDPTPQRLSKAREEGRVAQSKDLSGALQLAFALILFAVAAPALIQRIALDIQTSIERLSEGTPMATAFASAVEVHLWLVALPALGFCAALGLAAALPLWAQTGFLIAPKALRFKWETLDVFKRTGQIFGPKKLGMGLVLTSLKIGVAGTAVWVVLQAEILPIATLSAATIPAIAAKLISVAGKIALAATILLLVVSGLDYAWQRHQHWESMKMSKQEVKQEQEEQEGNALIKGRRKKMHRELTMNQILDAVPAATAIVTNPTHLAIAIRYRPGEDSAPLVTARGADSLAAHIRKLAREHGVPIIEHKPLARTLWRRVKVGSHVPSSLYQTVAEVLAQVYRARAERGEVVPGAAPGSQVIRPPSQGDPQ